MNRSWVRFPQAAQKRPPLQGWAFSSMDEAWAGCGGGQVLSVRPHEWLPNNVARNSLLTISTFEFMSLELQRFRGLSKTDRGKLRATCVVGRFASSADGRLLGLAVSLCDACPQGRLGARGVAGWARYARSRGVTLPDSVGPWPRRSRKCEATTTSWKIGKAILAHRAKVLMT